MPHSMNERIKSRRKELNMSQAELANQVGLKPPAISQYESGARKPSFEALRKLSFALKVSTEYLISGIDQEHADQPINNADDKVILRIIKSLSQIDKEKVVEYATFLATGRKVTMDILFETASEYADYYLEENLANQVPIDLYDFAIKLGIRVLEDILDEGEGLLVQGDQPIILLDSRQSHHRKKFTLATLLGHFIIPWHLKTSYVSRKYSDEDGVSNQKIKFGQSTLQTKEIEEMEAHTFAFNILIPNKELTKDISNITSLNFDTLKKLAFDKYNVSLFLFLNRLVDFDREKYAVVQSENGNILKTFPGTRKLKSTQEEVDSRTKAASFFKNPSLKEEIREGMVPASSWFDDAKEEEIVYEQSIYNPQRIGRVLTFLIY